MGFSYLYIYIYIYIQICIEEKETLTRRTFLAYSKINQLILKRFFYIYVVFSIGKCHDLIIYLLYCIEDRNPSQENLYFIFMYVKKKELLWKMSILFVSEYERLHQEDLLVTICYIHFLQIFIHSFYKFSNRPNFNGFVPLVNVQAITCVC